MDRGVCTTTSCCAPLPSQRLCSPCDCDAAIAPATRADALLTPCSASSNGARKVVARGMRRFEAFGGSLPAQPDVERLSPRVICVLGMNPSPYTLNGTCCYLVGTGPVRILVDAGGWPGGQEAEVEFVAHLKATLAEERVTSLSTIIVTHLHTDHFGGCRALQGVLGAPVPVAMLAPPPSQLSLYTIREIRARGLFDAVRAGPAPLFTGPTTFGFGGVPLPAWPNEDLSWDRARRTKRQMQADFFYALQHADFVDAWRDPRNESLPGVELHDGDAICVAGATLRVVATPGHAQNHCALWLDEEASLFSGDHVLGYGTTALHDLYDYMRSLGAMLALAPRRLYPGHGPVIDEACDLLRRYQAHRRAREKQVRVYLRDGVLADERGGASDVGDSLVARSAPGAAGAASGGAQSALAIARVLYAATPADRLAMATDNVEKILIKLWCDGAVVCEEPERAPRGTAAQSPTAVGARDAPWTEVDLTVKRYMRRLDPLYRWRWVVTSSKL